MDPRLSNLEIASAQMSAELRKLKDVTDERADKLLELSSAYSTLSTEVASLTGRLNCLVTTIARLVADVRRIDESTKVVQSRRYAANNNFRRKRKPNGH